MPGSMPAFSGFILTLTFLGLGVESFKLWGHKVENFLAISSK